MPTLRSHTHLQATQANAQAKACKRVCLPNRTDETTDNQADEKNTEPLTAPKKNGGGSGNINSCATNKHCAGRQFSVPKPPLLLAANRYRAF